MTIVIQESEGKYQVLVDGNVVGSVPAEANFSPELVLDIKSAALNENVLQLTVGVADLDESNHTFEIELPAVTTPAAVIAAPPAPNEKLAAIIARRRKGQIINRKLSVVEQRRMTGEQKIQAIIEKRRNGKI